MLYIYNIFIACIICNTMNVNMKIINRLFGAVALIAMSGTLACCQKLGPGFGQGSSIVPVVSSVATKGVIITTAGINHTGQSFGMQGYLDDDMATATGENVQASDKTNYHFLENKVLNYTGDNTNHSWDWSDVPATGTDEEKDAARPKWRSNVASRFWSYYPVSISTIVDGLAWPGSTASDSQQKVVTFSYSLPEPATAAPFQDAESQKDLLFAFTEKTYTSSTNDEININFYHALAAVNFDITTMGANVEFGTEITLGNVKDSGGCTATGNPAGNLVDFAWSDLSTTAIDSYSQSFDKAEDFEILGTAPDTYVRQKASGSKTFFMIPQKLTADTEIAVAFIFKDGGVPIRRTMKIGKIQDTDSDYVSWEAGKIYTYRISVGGDDFSLLDITLNVKDWVDGKQDVSF